MKAWVANTCKNVWSIESFCSARQVPKVDKSGFYTRKVTEEARVKIIAVLEKEGVGYFEPFNKKTKPLKVLMEGVRDGARHGSLSSPSEVR